jgi:uncharacterized protein
VVSSTVILAVPLIVLGSPPMLAPGVVERLPATPGSGSEAGTILWAIPTALLAVGWPLVRGPRTALTRLGLVRPSTGQIVVALLVAVLLVPVMIGLSQFVVRPLWDAFGWARTDQAALMRLFAPALTPFGAVLAAAAAGLGEELAVRGVLQPRLGVLLSNLFFTSLHALQYNWDALLPVFLLGIAFGVLRARTNTSTSAIGHAVYDLIVFELVVFGAYFMR